MDYCCRGGEDKCYCWRIEHEHYCNCCWYNKWKKKKRKKNRRRAPDGLLFIGLVGVPRCIIKRQRRVFIMEYHRKRGKEEYDHKQNVAFRDVDRVRQSKYETPNRGDRRRPVRDVAGPSEFKRAASRTFEMLIQVIGFVFFFFERRKKKEFFLSRQLDDIIIIIIIISEGDSVVMLLLSCA